MSSPVTNSPPRLGNILVERGYVRVEELQQALETQCQGTGKLLGEILVEMGFASDDQVIECLATVYGVPYAKLEPRLADPRAVDVLPREYIEKNLVFPLYKRICS
jgi:type IV pilus assembly protein PilB